jgi:dihydroorotase
MLKLLQPDDFHHHLRDGAALQDVVLHTARQFKRAIVMPNLKPPIRTVEEATNYRERILACTKDHYPQFEPLMTLYLTDNTTSEELRSAFATGYIVAVKYYPAGATTNSEFGVTSISKVMDVLHVSAV